MATNYWVPTLGSQLFLTNPKDIIEYTLRSYAKTPRSISDTYYPWVISLGDTITKNINDLTVLADKVQSDLASVFSRIFPNTSYQSISASTSPTSDNDGTFNLTISVLITINGIPYSVDDSVSIVNGTIVMSNDTVQNSSGS